MTRSHYGAEGDDALLHALRAAMQRLATSVDLPTCRGSVEMGGFAMERRMLKGIKRRAESAENSR